MAIARTLFKNNFRAIQIPDWTCPTCNTGFLKADSKKFKTYESKGSLFVHDHEDWDPTWIDGVFLGQLNCNNSKCGDTIVVTGKMNVEEGQEYDSENDHWDLVANEFLTPNCFIPPLNIFQIHEDVPDFIKKEIISAFNIYWLDIASCANKIRVVVEVIMDNFKIARTFIDSRKKRKGYSLHARIELFKKENPEEAELLMAIKWIGNGGSHRNYNLTKDDILDGFEILEHVSAKLYEKESGRIKKLSKKINKKRKPIGRLKPKHRTKP